MSREERAIPPVAMHTDQHGCTVLGAWVRFRLGQTDDPLPGEAQDPTAVGQPASGSSAAVSGTMDIDGVHVDPLLLSVVDPAGNPVAVSRMSVKELRAELVARRATVSGNKKDLAKRLQASGCF